MTPHDTVKDSMRTALQETRNALEALRSKDDTHINKTLSAAHAGLSDLQQDLKNYEEAR